MTIAIDDWAKNGNGEAEHEETGLPLESDESELLGEGAGEAQSTEHAPEPEHDALAAKKAKDMKIMKVAGGVLLVMGLGVGGLMTFGNHAASQPQQAQQQATPEIAPVVAQSAIAPVAAVAPVAMAIETPAPAPSGVTAVALDAPSAMALPSSPAAAPALAAPVVAAPTVAVATVAPVASLAAPVAAAQSIHVAIPSAPPVDVESKQVAGMRSDIESLRAEMQSIRADSAGKDKVIADLRKQGSPVVKHVAHQMVVKQPKEVIITELRPSRDSTVATAKAAVAKAVADQKPVVIVDPQVVAETKQTMVSPPASVKGGKVRSEFTVYAVSNGRAWVTWGKDNMNYTVGVNSELPDYSKVTSIDDVRGVVFTSAGEVHPKPATK